MADDFEIKNDLEKRSLVGIDGLSEREMLDQSSIELKLTLEELEKRFDIIDNEGNEWKTRFETQEEMNQQLEKQLLLLQQKVDEAKKNLKDASKTPRDANNFDDLSDANPVMVKHLEKEKQLLENQLRDMEWRLDQESKAYHKANDERKNYVLEINATKTSLDHMRMKQRAYLEQQYDKESLKSHRTPRDFSGNIPESQRIIDPKKGPIRRTAAVKSLPSIDSNET